MTVTEYPWKKGLFLLRISVAHVALGSILGVREEGVCSPHGFWEAGDEENGVRVSIPTRASVTSLFPTGFDLLRRLVTKPFRMWTFGV